MLKHAFGSTARPWRAAHQSELRVKGYIFLFGSLPHPHLKPETCSLETYETGTDACGLKPVAGKLITDQGRQFQVIKRGSLLTKQHYCF